MKYKPHKFQRAFLSSKAKIRVAIAGRFGGKTVMGVNEAIAASLNGLRGQLPIPNRGVIIAPSAQMAHDDLNPVIDEYLDRRYVKNRLKQRIDFLNGSHITIRSGYNPDALRGIHPHWVYFDEAAYLENSKAFDNMLLALQPNGKIWLTSTPKGFNWLYEKIVIHALEGKKDKYGYISNDGKYFAIKWSTFDNPHHAEDLVEMLERSLPDEKYRQQELYAEFVAYEGAVYNFDEKEIKAPMPPTYTDVIIGVDVGYKHPAAFEVLAYNDGIWYVVDEVVVQGKTTSQLADIGKKLADKWSDEAKFFISHEAPEAREEFRLRGLKVFMADHRVDYGIGLVRDAFREGKLKVVHAPKFLKEAKTYGYSDGKIRKINDDACDALRYAVSGFQRPMHARIIVPKITRWKPIETERRIW